MDNFEKFIADAPIEGGDILDKERLRDAVRTAVSSRQGRHLLWAILQQTGLMSLSYTGEANSTSFNEGQRNTGIWLMAQLDQYAPDAFLIMMKESKEDMTNDRRTTDNAVAG